MKIGIDIYGGDFAPEATIDGSIMALDELLADEQLVLIGNENVIRERCISKGVDPTRFEIVHTDEWIDMCEHPAKAFSSKPNSSIALGFGMLKKGHLDGFASAGSTGAMLVAAMYTIKSIPGVIRPVISAAIPNGTEKPTIMLDVGINPDAKPEVLYQYAVLGSLYSKYVYHVDSPRVALLNIGSEEEKGNIVTKAAFQLMRDSSEFNFVGNVEGNDLFTAGKADVIVCDGFVGNVVIKEAEALYGLLQKFKISHPFFESMNFENHGGVPILGVNGTAIIGHGVSNDKAIKSMVLSMRDIVKSDLTQRIKEAFC
jgi:glycerol-3-phosphate acyltransferase PlsX